MQRQVIEKLRQLGGDAFAVEMIDLFLSRAPARMSTLRQAVQEQDASALEHALHAIRSSSGQLGASTLEGLCGEAESLARDGCLPPVTPLVEKIEMDFTRVQGWLEGIRRELRPEP